MLLDKAIREVSCPHCSAEMRAFILYFIGHELPDTICQALLLNQS